MTLDYRTETRDVAWWRLLEPRHWFVVIIASAAWFFDCLDQRLFTLARIPALTSLMHLPAANSELQSYGKVVTAWFLIGWAIGGMTFGSLGDKFGRARMLTLTILTYAMFTSLSFFATSKIDFTICRGLTGLGIGGVFGLSVSLIAETVPSGARPQTLGLLQVLSTFGNISAVLVKMGMDALETSHVIRAGESWRYLFLVGAIPASIVAAVAWNLGEPAPWLEMKANGLLPKGSILAPYVKLLGEKRWRKNLIVGALISSTGVVGLWGIGEYAPDLQRAVFGNYFQQHSPAGTDVKPLVNSAINYAYILSMLGAAAGMWGFTRITAIVGRRTAFAIGFSAALMITFLVYWKLNSPLDAYWMAPLMTGAQLSLFAGFSIYLPELFPSSLRSSGVSFCYNVGRLAAAAGSFFSSGLTKNVYGHFAAPLPLRYAAMTMCAIFLIGLLTLPFAPETRGKPLP
jgi:MFS family permease